jgi:hypothetical protein
MGVLTIDFTEALETEIKWRRELLEKYARTGMDGTFGAAILEEAIGRAERALASGDDRRIAILCKQLQKDDVE